MIEKIFSVELHNQHVASLFIFSEKLVKSQVRSLRGKGQASKLLRRSSQNWVLWFLN